MKIFRGSETSANKGPADKFTGNVWVTVLFSSQQEDGLAAYLVLFEPGARTYWHAHEGEQMLYVVAGQGRVMEAGGPGGAILPGDSVIIAPGEKHWHGAAPDQFMAHVAITTGGPAEWMEAVAEKDYSLDQV